MMGTPRHPVPMLELIALAQGVDLQRAKLEGWGPPHADAARCRQHRDETAASPRSYAATTPRSSRAVRAVFSAVIPSFSRTSAPGALAPKRSIDTVRSTQRSHP
jgi:hypothetical protein